MVYAIRLLKYSDNIQKTVLCITLLKEAGASLSGMILTEEILHFAHVGNLDIIRMIYECDGSLDCVDHSGKNILHIAVLHGQTEIIKWVAKKPDLRFLFCKMDMYKKRAIDDAHLLSQSDHDFKVGHLEDIIVALEEGNNEIYENDNGLVQF